MEIQYYGANCVRIVTKKATIVVDDLTGGVAKSGDIVLFTGEHGNKLKAEVKIEIDQAGEYEVSDASIQGITARSHLEQAGDQSVTIYKIIGDDLRIAVMGHIYPELSDEQLESLGTIDVLIIPVGGGGYTLDAIGALKLIKEIEPKIIIPTHYADTEINYEVPQASLADVLKEISMEPKETVPKLKLKANELLGESNQLIILERQ